MSREPGNGGYWKWRSRRGVQIWVHWSCALAAGCVALVADRRLGRAHRDSPAAQRRLGAGSAGLVAVASIALHEAGHLIAARRLGLDPAAVVVAPFGGGTTIPRSAPTPATEAAFVLAGPAASLAMAGAVAGVAALMPRGPLRTTASLTAVTNLLLTVANLVPSLPMDGGVALRALAWHVTGDRDRAADHLRTVGRAAGAGLMAFGLLFTRRRTRWALVGAGLASLLGGGVSGAKDVSDPFGVISGRTTPPPPPRSAG